MARGIDTHAHRAALSAEGRTLAVLGTGLDRGYPEENRLLAAVIAERGAILSELPLGTPPSQLRAPPSDRLHPGNGQAGPNMRSGFQA